MVQYASRYRNSVSDNQFINCKLNDNIIFFNQNEEYNENAITWEKSSLILKIMRILEICVEMQRAIEYFNIDSIIKRHQNIFLNDSRFMIIDIKESDKMKENMDYLLAGFENDEIFHFIYFNHNDNSGLIFTDKALYYGDEKRINYSEINLVLANYPNIILNDKITITLFNNKKDKFIIDELKNIIVEIMNTEELRNDFKLYNVELLIDQMKKILVEEDSLDINDLKQALDAYEIVESSYKYVLSEIKSFYNIEKF